MSLIEVTEELLVGYNPIDDEHRELFLRINELHDAIENKMDKPDIEMIFNFLEDYVIIHFGMEERLMIKTSYPKFALHREKHTYFIEELIRIRDSFRSAVDGKVWEYARAMELLLKDWLIHHIQVFDRELARFASN